MEAFPIVKTVVFVSLPDISQQAGGIQFDGSVMNNTLTWRKQGIDVFSYVCMNGLGANMREEDCTTPYFKGKVLTEEVEDWMDKFGRTLAAGVSVFGRR